MADIEKVIKGLEHCTRPSESGKRTDFCMGCPYWSPIGFNQFICTSQRMKKDALELLKDQDNQIHHMGLIVEEYEKELKKAKKAKPEEYLMETGELAEMCGACGAVMRFEPCFCPFCGTEIDRSEG